MFPALGEEIPPHRLAQRLQPVQLVVGELSSTAHPCFLDPAQPFRPMPRCVDLRTAASNAPTVVQGLEPIHHSRQILGDRQITARQLLQRTQTPFSVVDGRERTIRSSSASFCASIRSPLLPDFSKAFLRGLHTVTLLTYGLSRSYNQAAQVPSSKVTSRFPRSPRTNCRIVAALVSRMDSITTLPAEFITATAIASL